MLRAWTCLGSVCQKQGKQVQAQHVHHSMGGIGGHRRAGQMVQTDREVEPLVEGQGCGWVGCGSQWRVLTGERSKGAVAGNMQCVGLQ